jgi:G3E family GTPase
MSAGWIQELEGIHTPETEEYGINSFVFRDHRPFHPQRFWEFVTNFPSEIIRSKGLFWLASRPKQALNWSQAGGSTKAEGAGVWWVSMPFSQRIQHPNFVENQRTIEERWCLDFGDRLNEIVFIGIQMNSSELQKKIEACLCTTNEIMDLQDGFFSNKDQFPVVNPYITEANGIVSFYN